jgi:hypothetical protein
MSNKSTASGATMGIDIGKNSFHVVGLNQRSDCATAEVVARARSKHGLRTCRLS